MPGRKGRAFGDSRPMRDGLTPSPASVAAFTARTIPHAPGVFPTDTDGLARDRPNGLRVTVEHLQGERAASSGTRRDPY